MFSKLILRLAFWFGYLLGVALGACLVPGETLSSTLHGLWLGLIFFCLGTLGELLWDSYCEMKDLIVAHDG